MERNSGKKSRFEFDVIVELGTLRSNSIDLMYALMPLKHSLNIHMYQRL